MQRKVNLTKAKIDQLTYEATNGKRQVLWDGLIPGFGVRVFPSGKKAFVVSYRALGQSRLMTIGRYGVMTLDQARDACRELLVTVSKGVDPLAIRKLGRQAETFGDLWTSFLEDYAKPKKRSWDEDEMRFKRHVPDSWKSRKINSITNKDIESLHAKIGRTSIFEANRTLALISKMYNFARLPNPAKGIQKFPEERRSRWLTTDEILQLKDGIAKEPNVYIRALVWLWLYTGTRKSELQYAQWSEVSFEQKALLLKKTKNGKPFVVSLSDPALQILKHLPKEAGNPHVFPGAVKGKALSNVHKPWARILKNANLSGVQIRDLRRSFASMQVQRGVSLQLTGKLLNHSNTKTTEIYAHLADQQMRDAVEVHGEQLKELIGEV